jgi:phosphoacetylglucosamine mutase
MLETSWEAHASTLANASTTHDLIEAIETIIRSARIDISKPARVVYGRDTRPSGPALVAALRDGLTAIGADIRDAGVVTTPILHYLVRAINTKGTKDAYGDDSEDGYFGKLSGAFKRLVVSHCPVSHCLHETNKLCRPENKRLRH